MKTKKLSITPGKHRAPASGRHRVSSEALRGKNRGASPARWLLNRHVTRGQSQPATPQPEVATPHQQSELLGDKEVSERSIYTTLQNSDIVLDNRKPILSRDEVAGKAGLDFGALQAVVHRPDLPPLFCFNRSTRNEAGDKRVSYLIMSEDQIDLVKRAHDPGSQEAVKRHLLLLNRSDRQSSVVGPNHPLPGSRESVFREKDGSISDPALRGDVQFYVKQESGVAHLGIDDLDGNGTVVQHNPEFVEPRDPWEGHPLTPPRYFPLAGVQRPPQA